MVLYKADINGKVVIPSNENVDVIRKGEVDPLAVNILFAENSYVVMFGDEAFQNFTKLTTIIIPSSVISIIDYSYCRQICTFIEHILKIVYINNRIGDSNSC